MLAIAAVLGATPASAQNVAAADADQEIVITAQRREQALQDVPVSVAVLDGEDLDRSSVAGIVETLARVPGVAVQGSDTASTLITIRGIVPGSAVVAGSTAAGFYLDSAPFGMVRHAFVPNANVYDLDRVEVLRGPQGTLYGANSVSGVIRILTHRANLDQFEVKSRASIAGVAHGNPDFRGDIAVNVPLIEGALAARGVLGYGATGGWIDRASEANANSGYDFNGRIRFDAKPTEKLDLAASVWLFRHKIDTSNRSDSSYRNADLLDAPGKSRFNLYNFTATYDFSSFTLTSATSYLDFNNASNTFRRGPNNLGSTEIVSKIFTEEVTLTSTGEGPWRWTLGSMYRNAKEDFFQTRPDRILPTRPGVVTPIFFEDRSKSIAVYGDLTRLLFGDRLEIAAGLRYFHDKVSTQELVKTDGTSNPLHFRSSKFDAFTPRFSLSWHANRDLMFYATYSQGFRSGFDQTPLSLNIVPDFAPVKPDRLSNHEGGLKGSLFDRLVTIDASVYYLKWKNAQQILVVFGPPGSNLLSIVTVNAAQASGWGVDLAVTVNPTAGLSFGGGVGWNGVQLDEDVIQLGGVLLAKGDRLGASPEWTANAFADYEFDVGSHMKANVSVSANYNSARQGRAFVAGLGSTIISSDNILLARANVGIGARDDSWRLSLFADNIFDVQRTLNPFTPGAEAPDGSEFTRPRTIGVQFEVKM